MPSELNSLNLSGSDFGGDVKLEWAYPDDFNADTQQLFIFKKSSAAVDEALIDQYFAGTLKNSDLSDNGIFAFQNISAKQSYIVDLTVQSDVEYFYSATIYDSQGKIRSTSVVQSYKPHPSVVLNTLDTKDKVIRAVKTMMDVLRSVKGLKVTVDKDIRVLRDHSKTKEEDTVIVVQRVSAQSIVRQLSDVIAQTQDSTVLGETDSDALRIEWIAIENPLRRDQLTNLFRAGRQIIRYYIILGGNQDIKDVRFIMGGDEEGEYNGGYAYRGSMTALVELESQVQVGRDDLAYWTSIENTYLGDDQDV